MRACVRGGNFDAFNRISGAEISESGFVNRRHAFSQRVVLAVFEFRLKIFAGFSSAVAREFFRAQSWLEFFFGRFCDACHG
jgi:hypothetical protein